MLPFSRSLLPRLCSYFLEWIYYWIVPNDPLDILSHNRRYFDDHLKSFPQIFVCVTDLRPLLALSYLYLTRYSNVKFLIPYSLPPCDYGESQSLIRLSIYKILRFYLKPIPIHPSSPASYTPSLGVFSSLASIETNSSPSLDTYPETSASLIKLDQYALGFVDHISRERADLIIIFNGRTAFSYHVARYAKHQSILTYYLEYSSCVLGFRLFTESPHSPGNLSRECIRLLRRYPPRSSDISRLRGELASLIKRKCAPFVPDGSDLLGLKSSFPFDIAFVFCGSDHEYCFTDPFVTGLPSNGNIELLDYVFSRHIGDTPCVRLHPNSIGDPTLCSQLEVFGNIAEKYNVNMIVDHARIPIPLIAVKATKLYVFQSTVAYDLHFMGRDVQFSHSTSDFQEFYASFLEFSHLFDSSLSYLAFGLYLSSFAYTIPLPLHYRILNVLVSYCTRAIGASSIHLQ